MHYVFNGDGTYAYGWDDETRTYYYLHPETGEVEGSRPYNDQENWEADMRQPPKHRDPSVILQEISILTQEYIRGGGDRSDCTLTVERA